MAACRNSHEIAEVRGCSCQSCTAEQSLRTTSSTKQLASTLFKTGDQGQSKAAQQRHLRLPV
jgi:hypothetical protein